MGATGIGQLSRTTAIFAASLAALGCHGGAPGTAPAPGAVEKTAAPITSAQVTSARSAGYLAGLTPPYAALELFDDPVSIQSTGSPCLSGGTGGKLINNGGVVIGFDCRNQLHFWPQTAVVDYPVYSDPSGTFGPLSSAIINHTPTYALPIPSTARSSFPTGIMDTGYIWGFDFTAPNTWGPTVYWNTDHTLWTGASPPPIAGANANSRGDVVGSVAHADGTNWAQATENGTVVDINASVHGTNPFMRVEALGAVNENRQAVGYGLLPGSTSSAWYRRAAVVDLNTNTVTALPSLPYPYTFANTDHVASGINAKGHVAGSSMSGNTFSAPGVYPWGHAFTWTFEWGIRDLNLYINPSLAQTLSQAYALNDNDEIVGLDVASSGSYRLFRTKIDFNQGGPEFYEPTNGQTCSLASGVNNSGQVTGWSDGCASPWAGTSQVYPFATNTNGVPLQLGALAGVSIYPSAINNAGYVSANAYDSATSMNSPLLYHPSSWSEPEQPSAFTNAATTTALNNVADANGGPMVVGAETVPSTGQTWFSYQNGQKTLLPQLAGSAGGGVPTAAADDGTMVGSFSTSSGRVAAAWINGAMVDMNTLLPSGSGWTLTMALGLNNSHWAVGFGAHNGNRRPFKMSLDSGTIIDIGTMESPNNTLATNATAVNSIGHVVGTAGTPPTGDTLGVNLTGSRAFFFAEDSGITDINTIVNMPPGWVLAAATGINDSDEVVGYAVQTATGIRRAYKARIPGLPTTECTGKANGAPCNDLNRCTQSDTCQNGVCVGGNPIVCPTPDQCHTAGTCQAATGVCTNPAKANGTACNDNNACTSADVCTSGVCGGSAITCTAIDQCHVAGTCDPAVGCSTPAKVDGTACNDSNACTQSDTCQGGACTGGPAVTCSSGNVCVPTAGAAPYPTNGLMGLWHLDGNVKDSSEGGNHFTTSYGLDIVPGQVGTAYQYSGTSCAYQTGNYSNDLANTSGITFLAWMKPSGTCPGAWPVFQRSTEFGVQLSCSSTGAPGVSIAINTGSGLTYSAPYGSLPVGQWSLVAVTWDGTQSGQVAVYINGVPAGAPPAQPGSIAAAQGSYMWLGCYSTYYAGALDEVALYTRALSLDDINKLLVVPNACTPPPCNAQDSCHTAALDGQGNCIQTQKAVGASCASSNPCIDSGATCDAYGSCQGGTPHTCAAPSDLCSESTCDPYYTPIAASDYIAQWHFDGDFSDASGSGNDLTTGTSTVQIVPGKFGQAMHVGSNSSTSCASRIAGPSNDLNNPNGVQFTAWVMPDAGLCPGSGSHILFQRQNEFGVSLACKSDNSIGVTVGLNLAGTINWSVPAGTLPVGQWSQVTAGWSHGGAWGVSINGVGVTGQYVYPSDIYHAASVVYVGCGTGATIDEATLSRRPLTTLDVARQYQSPSLCNVHAKTCQPTDSCHGPGTCNPTSGCVYPQHATGSSCSDNNSCTTGDTCSAAGTCTPGTPVNVTCGPAANQCQQNVCDPTQEPKPPANGLVGWWRLDGDTHDSGPYGLDLVNYGAQPTGGKMGGAYDFDGTTCIAAPLTNSKTDLSQASGVTMMAWVRTPAGAQAPSTLTYGTVMTHGLDYSLGTSWAAPGAAPGATGQVHTTTATGWGFPSNTGGLWLGTWTHIAFTWDKATNYFREYVNGQPGYGMATTGTLTDVSSYFNIGCNWNYPQMNYKGSVDEAVLYNRALSPSELQAYVNSVNTPTCAAQNKPTGASCDDGNACTTGDSCQAGACASGTPKACTASDQCHGAGTCDPASGACSNPPVADGTACNDNNACTQADACLGGACQGTNAVTCVASDGCHAAGTCDPGTGTCSNPVQPGGSCALGIWAGSPTIVEPGPNMTCSAATGINAAGTIVGYSDVCNGPDVPGTQAATAFVQSSGTIQQLALPSGATALFPSAVSDSGYVVGNAAGSSPNAAYVYRPGSSQPESLSLGAFGSKAWAAQTIPYTELPLVVGEGVTSAAGGQWVWTTTALQPTGNPPNPPSSFAPPAGFTGEGTILGLNQQGDMVGYYTDSTGARTAMVSLGGGPLQPLHDLLEHDPLGAALWTLETAVAINNDQQIVGVGQFSGTRTAFRLDVQRGLAVSIETVDPYSQDLITDANLPHNPMAINNSGIIVGTIGTPAGPSGQNIIPTRAFISYGDTLFDLNNFVSMPAGWVLIAATGINDNNQVSGVALNPATGLPVAYEVTPQGLPSAAQIECATLNEGASCMHGNFCPTNNVCHNSVCGGQDPVDAVCLRVDGVVNDRNGRPVALFGFDNPTSQTIVPTVNQELIDGVVVPLPEPAPPPWLPAGDHTAAFQATFGSGQRASWRVGGQQVNADSIPTLAPLPNVPGVQVSIDGGPPIVIDPDLSAYTRPPGDPTTGSEPPVGAPDRGRLTGSLSVSPMGAAVYSVPIAIPPGIGGMAPNLSLVYNSQAGDDIAGQGWGLTGLSMIHLCPKTRTEDGFVEAIDLDPPPTATVAHPPPKGGICLDGVRLFDQGDGTTFTTEITDHSTVTKRADGSFVVETKSGERRFYGFRPESRVSITPDGATSPTQVAVWPLDRVVDRWGNYYTLTYNNGQGGADFQTEGLIVTSIDYTGHMQLGSDPTQGLQTFSTISFSYEARQDVRRLRFGQGSLPRNRRLTRITTPTGYYALDYAAATNAADDAMLPSRLGSLRFCPNGASDPEGCTESLSFDWQGGGFGMVENDAFAPPRPINIFLQDNNSRLEPHGNLFIDLDGDGLVDFIQASQLDQHVWKNTGETFQEWPYWALPNNLFDEEGDPAGATLADLNGDGLPDYVQNPNGSTFCDGSSCPDHPNILGYTNEIKNGCPGGVCWKPLVAYAALPAGWGNVDLLAEHNKDYMVDMDGDGRVDLARIVPTQLHQDYDPNCTTPALCQPIDQYYDNGDLLVLLNKPSGWVATTQYSFANSTLRGHIDPFDGPGGGHGYHLEDVNRDGLTDLIANQPDGNGTYYVGINTGSSGNVWMPSDTPVDPNRDDKVPGAKQFGDINGDGLYDSVQFYDLRLGTVGFQVNRTPNVAIGTGLGYLSNVNTTNGFASALQLYGPQPPAPLNSFVGLPGQGSPYYFSMADFNGDGLADLVMNRPDGGRIFANTGDTWLPIDPSTDLHSTAGANGLAVVPIVGSNGDIYPGAHFVDLNGDGMVDMVQSYDDQNGHPLARKAWLNTFVPPAIWQFPNGLAAKTQVSYAPISSPTAGFAYTDLEPVAPGTTLMTPPIRVVTAVSQEDGRGIGSLATTNYQYQSFRGSAVGRGPQGFMRTLVTEPTDTTNPDISKRTIGTTTATTYSQVYPYTGMPTIVERKKGSTILNHTETTYCDQVAPRGTTPLCSSQTLADLNAPVGTHTTRTAYTLSAVDTAYLIGSDEILTTNTDTRHDAYGNVMSISVSVQRSDGDGSSTITNNYYGSEGSDEQKQGLATTVEVVKQSGTSPARSHATTFSYSSFGGYTDEDGTVRQALALKTEITERTSSPDENATTQTEYDYDTFGHTVTTTTCASDFASCAAGATNPADSDSSVDHGLHPSFRTIRMSYDSSALNFVTGAGITAVTGYASGRFPTSSSNAENDTEAYVYSPVSGVLLQRAAPNGLHTCYEYDGLGRQVSVTERCGSAFPLKTTTEVDASLDFAGHEYPLVAVTRAPDGSASWAYTDVLGRKATTLTRGLDGSLIEKGKATFDMLGRPSMETEPRFFYSGSAFATTHGYNALGLEETTTRVLGPINGVVDGAVSTVTRTFQGSTIASTEVITKISDDNSASQVTRTRSETKDANGRLHQVTYIGSDGLSNSLTHTSDSDGNLLSTDIAAAGVPTSTVSATYDTAGRKIASTDPDLGGWTYTYNGFSDMVQQKNGRHDLTSMQYDVLGRLVAKSDAFGTAEWIYATSGPGVGQLQAMIGRPDDKLKAPCSVPGEGSLDGNRAAKWFTFTDFGEVKEAFECVDGVTVSTIHEYDNKFGRPFRLQYPEIDGNRLAVLYGYTSLGALQYLTDGSTGHVLWQVKAMNARGQVAVEQLGNGVETVVSRNDSTGWLTRTQSVSHAQNELPIQTWDYWYDEAGNVIRRNRTDVSIPDPSAESFGFDSLDRITSSRVRINVGGPRAYDVTDTFGYDGYGNLRQKGDKVLTYDSMCPAQSRSAGPHAVCTYDGSAPFQYDDDGNLLAGNGRSISYNVSDKVTNITDSAASQSVDFGYGADGNRVVQEVDAFGADHVSTARTLYFGLGATGKSLYERTAKDDGTIEHTQFLYAGSAHGGSAFAVRTTTTVSSMPGSSTPELKYYHFDHLGSVTAISDQDGRVLNSSWGGGATVMGYDTWGARRQPDGRAADPSSFELQAGHREYTGHETIPSLDLVNMNGRIYDPLLGRFMSGDPTIQSPEDHQNYNRYSYVQNNPLKYTDPTGYRKTHVFGASTDADISLGLQLGSMVACAVPGGQAACITAFSMQTVWTATTMRAGGLGWDQIAAVTFINAAGFALGQSGIMGVDPDDLSSHVTSQAILHGAISGAQAAFTSEIATGHVDWVGVSTSAAMAAFMAGATEEARYSALSKNVQDDAATVANRYRKLLETNPFRLKDPTADWPEAAPAPPPPPVYYVDNGPTNVDIAVQLCSVPRDMPPPEFVNRMGRVVMADSPVVINGNNAAVVGLGWGASAQFFVGGEGAGQLVLDSRGGVGIVFSGGYRQGMSFGFSFGPTISVGLGTIYSFDSSVYGGMVLDAGPLGSVGLTASSSGPTLSRSPPWTIKPLGGFQGGISGVVGGSTLIVIIPPR